MFNVVGTGQKVSLAGDSIFNGILMANDRTVALRKNATVSGEIIANRIKLRGSSRVLHPPVISPLVDTVSEAEGRQVGGSPASVASAFDASTRKPIDTAPRVRVVSWSMPSFPCRKQPLDAVQYGE